MVTMVMEGLYTNESDKFEKVENDEETLNKLQQDITSYTVNYQSAPW